jgi:hypothetical protein
MELDLHSKLLKSLEQEARDANRTLQAHIVRKLENMTPPLENIDLNIVKNGLPDLVAFFDKIPSVRVMSHDSTRDAYWWIKFAIDISHPLAWKVVQELGFVLNYISVSERLPTVFMPVSPPPYLNGGPDECLSWVVESKFNYIDPKWIAKTLEGRLPNPVSDIGKWGNQTEQTEGGVIVAEGKSTSEPPVPAGWWKRLFRGK